MPILEYSRKPFYIASYIDEYYNIPRNIMIDLNTYQLYTVDNDSMDIVIGEYEAKAIMERYIKEIRDDVSSYGDTYKKIKDFIDAISEWVDSQSDMSSPDITGILGILDFFKNLNLDYIDDLNNKVDKVDDYGLTDNNFTSEDYEKLLNINDGSNNYTHSKYKVCMYIPPVISVNRRSGDVILTKEDFGLENVEPNANRYVHPISKQCNKIGVDSVNTKTGSLVLNKSDISLSNINNWGLSDFSHINSLSNNIYSNTANSISNLAILLVNSTKNVEINKFKDIIVDITPRDSLLEIFFDKEPFSNNSRNNTIIKSDFTPGIYQYKVTHPRDPRIVVSGSINLINSIDTIRHRLLGSFMYRILESDNVNIKREIFINTSWVQFGTSGIELVEGEYIVRVSAPGYVSQNWGVVIDNTKTDTITLDRKVLDLIIRTDPSDAITDIDIFCRRTHTTMEKVSKNTIIKLKSGSYDIISKDSILYARAEENITLVDDNKEVIIKLKENPVKIEFYATNAPLDPDINDKMDIRVTDNDTGKFLGRYRDGGNDVMVPRGAKINCTIVNIYSIYTADDFSVTVPANNTSGVFRIAVRMTETPIRIEYTTNLGSRASIRVTHSSGSFTTSGSGGTALIYRGPVNLRATASGYYASEIQDPTPYNGKFYHLNLIKKPEPQPETANKPILTFELIPTSARVESITNARYIRQWVYEVEPNTDINYKVLRSSSWNEVEGTVRLTGNRTIRVELTPVGEPQPQPTPEPQPTPTPPATDTSRNITVRLTMSPRRAAGIRCRVHSGSSGSFSTGLQNPKSSTGLVAEWDFTIPSNGQYRLDIMPYEDDANIWASVSTGITVSSNNQIFSYSRNEPIKKSVRVVVSNRNAYIGNIVLRNSRDQASNVTINPSTVASTYDFIVENVTPGSYTYSIDGYYANIHGGRPSSGLPVTGSVTVSDITGGTIHVNFPLGIK